MSLRAFLEHLSLNAITAIGESRRDTELSQTGFLFLKRNMSGTLKNSSDQIYERSIGKM